MICDPAKVRSSSSSDIYNVQWSVSLQGVDFEMKPGPSKIKHLLFFSTCQICRITWTWWIWDLADSCCTRCECRLGRSIAVPCIRVGLVNDNVFNRSSFKFFFFFWTAIVMRFTWMPTTNWIEQERGYRNSRASPQRSGARAFADNYATFGFVAQNPPLDGRVSRAHVLHLVFTTRAHFQRRSFSFFLLSIFVH